MNVIIRLDAEPSDLAVRGSFACGDPALDKETEDGIIERVERGDVWAWADVMVEARIEGYSARGRSTLGACSYENEEDFKKHSGYYDAMVQEAVRDLHFQLQVIVDKGEAAKTIIGQVLIAPVVEE